MTQKYGSASNPAGCATPVLGMGNTCADGENYGVSGILPSNEPGTGPVNTWLPLAQRRPLYQLNHDLDTQTSGTNSIGVGKYDALQASVRERPTDGLEFMASYTWGKALSDNVGYYGVGWGQTAVQGFYYLDSTDPLRDYGPSPYDVRHMFSFAANYELPFGKGKKHDMSGAADAALEAGGSTRFSTPTPAWR